MPKGGAKKRTASSGWNRTDLRGAVPHLLNATLASLDNYGGPRLTQPRFPATPSIDHGLNADVPKGITTVQRGLHRIVHGVVDIGAAEVQSSRKAIVVTALGHSFVDLRD